MAKESPNVTQQWHTWFSWAIGLMPGLAARSPAAAQEWAAFVRWMEQIQHTVPWKHLKAWFTHLRTRVQESKECSFHPSSFSYLWDLWREQLCRQEGVNLFSVTMHQTLTATNVSLRPIGGGNPNDGRVRPSGAPAGGGERKPCGFFNRPRGCRAGDSCSHAHVCKKT